MENITVENIFVFIKEYGLPLVLFIMTIVWLKPKAEQVWDYFVKAAKPPESKGETMSRDVKAILETNGRISEVLLGMVSECDIESATLWQYHNGEQGLSGMPFLKVSATHQRVAPGQTQWANLYQAVPVSLVLHPTFIQDKDSYQVDEHTADFFGVEGIMRALGVKSLCLFPIRSSYDVPIAVLMISFGPAQACDEKQQQVLVRGATRIGALLEVYHYAASGVKHNG